MENKYRNHTCGELNIKNVGEEVKLAGWVQRIRNLGAMKFIDLRDEARYYSNSYKWRNKYKRRRASNRMCNICRWRSYRTLK